ncbi:DgyrCDS9564 [Dimorphilus gyrociliatus]|uniref:DgyrCDS9564 n=1 Tax=Dimorphilus gyrociliatus TaxID=2664684 RepID=A0A7I8VXR2_9ANNE|nr:DgyrCDS9564 [Dimorphilus gyrociliatus]
MFKKRKSRPSSAKSETSIEESVRSSLPLPTKSGRPLSSHFQNLIRSPFSSKRRQLPVPQVDVPKTAPITTTAAVTNSTQIITPSDELQRRSRIPVAKTATNRPRSLPNVDQIGVRVSNISAFDGPPTPPKLQNLLENEWKVKNIQEWNIEDVVNWCLATGQIGAVTSVRESKVNGALLLNLKREELCQLGISLAGLSALKHRHSVKKSFDSLSNEDNLEISGSLIQNRLSDLRKASEDQDKRINASLTELQEERRKADDLLQDFQPYDVFASPSFGNKNIEHFPSPNKSDDDLKFRGKPLSNWTRQDVNNWLGSIKLEKFSPNFRSISVKELPLIDGKALDKMNIKILSYREKILVELSKLKHLNGLDKKMIEEGVEEEVGAAEEIITKEGVEEEEAQKNEEEEEEEDAEGGEEEVEEEVEAEEEEEEEEEIVGVKRIVQGKYMEKGSLKKSFRPMNWVEIWHDFGDNIPTGSLCAEKFASLEDTTAKEIVNNLLNKHNVTHDFNLFYLSEWFVEGARQGAHRELNPSESPYKIQKEWGRNSKNRFLLRHKNGASVKIINKIEGEKSRGKQFSVSFVSTCKDVIMTALRKFKIDTKNSEDYVLIQIDKEKSVYSLVKNDEIVLDLENDSFYLCDKSTASNLLAKASKSFLPSPVRRSKLHTVEVQMANIEASILDCDKPLKRTSSKRFRPSTAEPQLPNKRSITPIFMERTSTPINSGRTTPRLNQTADDHLEEEFDSLQILREIELLKESIKERDKNMLVLKEENSRLFSKAEEVVRVERALNALQDEFDKQQRTFVNENATCKNCIEQSKIERKIIELERQLKHVLLRIDRKKRNSLNLGGHNDNDYKVLRQAEGMILVDLENAKKELNLLEVKQEGPRLENVLEERKIIEIVNLDTSCGLQFMYGRESNHHLIVHHAHPDSNLAKNDLILKINDKWICTMKDEDLRNSMKSKNLQLVILRRQDISETDLDDLREDLSMALIELESVSNENKELSTKIIKVEEEKDKMEFEIRTLKHKLKKFEEGSAFEIDIVSGSSVESAI